MATIDANDLIAMLVERGVDDAMMVVAGMSSTMYEPAANACVWWDRLREERGPGKIGVGLLVDRLNKGGVPVLDEVDDDVPPVVTSLTDRIRWVALGIDGINREELGAIYGAAAREANLRVNRLIDSALGAKWVETPPHPCKLNEPLAAARYHALLHGQAMSPDYSVTRGTGESDHDFSMRFWRWQDDDAVKAADVALAQRREATAERVVAEQEAPAPPAEQVAAEKAEIAPEPQPAEPEDDGWTE